ncbi:hypothetical protein NEFER03_0599 [Nematocida sp. LUAm3]|nr:hypothetical protein NEFER03_0599 [Nematocida sp. LUAm3]KAI5175566.1 hypothetical protein NEFER02_1472 [Nematocida sp. LUAm2]KAI5178404.1 hypothetical protein NEFER01_1551 [Nematocida sp. LUAm1]
MKQYQSKGAFLVKAAAAFLLTGYTEIGAYAQMALGGGMNPMCAQDFFKGGSNMLGSMGVNGMGGIGGGFRMNSPTICVKQDDAMIKGALKKASSLQALKALLNLQNADCTQKKISPAAQACFLHKVIMQKASRPTHTITSSNNALVLTSKRGTDIMIIVEKFGPISPKTTPNKTFQNISKDPTSYTAQFSEFDDVLKRIGQPKRYKKSNKCDACLQNLKANILMGDSECNVCGETIPLSLEELGDSLSGTGGMVE